jgi:hypothetical protein
MESIPRFPQSLEIAARFPHSQQADNEADGKVENQKQVSHFPTARFSPSLKQKTRARLQPRSSNFKTSDKSGKIVVPEWKNT